MRLIRKAKKGFSLVELVVVIAVIAILSAVSVGAYFGITDSANNSRLDQEARMVRSNIQLVASGTDTNVSLRKDGLYIKNVGDFEGKLNEYSGLDYFVTNDENDLDSISRPTIFLKEAGYTLAIINGAKTYKTFDYYSPEVSGKKAYVDLVKDNLTIINDNFTIVEPCEHNWVEDEVLSQPTCISNGSKQYTCSKCEETKTEDIPLDPNRHTYESAVTNPTCTTEGYTTYTCKDCRHTYTDAKVDATGHDYNSVVTPPTCTEDGYTTYTCTDCGYSYVDDEVDHLGHDYESVVTPPTCTTEGYTTHTCKNPGCGHTYTDSTVAAKGHNYESEVTTPATCTEDGIRTYTCKDGDHTYTEVIPATGHNYDSVVTPPTCTEAGYTTHTCTNDGCDDSYTDTPVSATGHNYESDVTKEATCTEDGLRTYTCKDGDHAYTETIPATGHNYESEITTPATCTTKGVRTYRCACGDSYTEEIEATGHSYVLTNSKQPTCVDKGFETYTCNNKGCNDSYTTELKELGHEYKEVVTSPTCTAQGYTTYTCMRENCGHSYVDNYTDIIDHTYVSGECSVCQAKDPNYKSITVDSCPSVMRINEIGAKIVASYAQGSGTIKYYSSDDSVVSVDESGLLTAKKAGTVTVYAYDSSNNAIKSTTKTIEVKNEYRVYFENNWKWTSVKAYYWTSSGDNGWPGTSMTFLRKTDNENKYSIYYADIPTNATGLIFNGIKNDGSGSTDKTPDITSGFNEPYRCYYMKWTDKNDVGHYTLENY